MARRSAIFVLALAWGLARVALAGPSVLEEESPPYPHPPEEPIPIAVLPLGLSHQTAERYPQLMERNVGLGIHNMIVNELYDTHWFRFVEDKPEIIEDLLERQWISASGGVSSDSAVEYGRLLGARYVLYGEVYDFSARRLRKKEGETRISIQIRLIDVETSQYVPASGTGTVVRKGEVLPKGDNVAFARSTIGLATEESLERAVAQLIERLSRQTSKEGR